MAPSPHDALFKATFSQLPNARPMLQHELPPELAKAAQWDTLVVLPGSFIDEALRDTHSDLLFSVEMRSRPALIYVLFEHQSTVDPWMPLRLLEYMIRIWQAHRAAKPTDRSLPPILPLVLHHSEHGWTAATSFEALFERDPSLEAELAPFLPSFRFLLDDLSHATDDDLRARAVSAVSKLVLGCLRHARQIPELLQEANRWSDVLKEIAEAPHGVHALRLVLRYMFEVSDGDATEEIRRFFQPIDKPRFAEDFVTLAEQLREMGRAEGKAEGKAEGEAKGQAEGLAQALLTVLRAKFGEVPPQAATKVKSADPSTIDQWLERAVRAATLDAVFADR